MTEAADPAMSSRGRPPNVAEDELMPHPRRSSAAVAAPQSRSLAAACGSDDDATTDAPRCHGRQQQHRRATTGTDIDADSITLVTYDSFPEADTSLNDALAEFSAETGIDVEILVAGDTGTMLSKAALTAGNPEGDVMWGIDNTLLSRAIDDDVFEPVRRGADRRRLGRRSRRSSSNSCRTAKRRRSTSATSASTTTSAGSPSATSSRRRSFADLTDPAYAGTLVVQNPATSSPGLAFLLATIHEYGIEGWQDYWSQLGENGVEVVEGWTQAYYERFTWAGGGPTPMVVSYGSSPPAEVIFAEPPRDDAPTGVIEDTCFRQVEFAGVLRGTDAPDEARQLVDFLVSRTFQQELALNLFVYPTNEAVELPQEFVDFAVVPDDVTIARSGR